MKYALGHWWREVVTLLSTNLGGRLLVLGVLVVSVSLVWWRLQGLQPLLEEIDKTNRQVSRLTDQIQQMETQYDTNESVVLSARYRRMQDSLFTNAEHVSVWMDQLKSAMIPLALEAKIQLGATQAFDTNGYSFTRMPATLEARPAVGVASPFSSYQRLLSLCQVLINQTQRVDLVGLEATGQSNSVTQARLDLVLWARSGEF